MSPCWSFFHCIIQVRCVAVHRDLVVSGSWDRTARIWDSKTGECIRILEHEKHIRQDGQYSDTGVYPDTGTLEAYQVGRIVLGYWSISGYWNIISISGRRIVFGYWSISGYWNMRSISGRTKDGRIVEDRALGIYPNSVYALSHQYADFISV